MTETAATRAHARLAPSAAHRWSRCPGSVSMEDKFPDVSSEAAEHGTAAHELAAHCLLQGFDAKRFLGRKINVNGTCAADTFLAPGSPGGSGIYEVDQEMVDGVQGFIKLVRTHCDGAKGEMLVEQRVHARRIHETEVHGVGDTIIYRPDQKVLHVFDLKYGRGVVVSAEKNEQLAIYASGARMNYHNRGVEEIHTHIYQPRAPHPQGPHRAWMYLPQELDEMERKLGDAANAVLEADAAYGKDSNWNDTYLGAGEHCRFCKAGAVCPERAKYALDVAKTEFGDATELTPPEKMTPDQLGVVLKKARQIQHWIKAVEEYAAAEAKEGRVPLGFKQVAGRTSRSWSDEAQLEALLPVICSVEIDSLYEAPKLLSPAKMEKLLPADARSELEPFIKKVQGGVLLVPEDDPRPAVNPGAQSEFDDVSNG